MLRPILLTLCVTFFFGNSSLRPQEKSFLGKTADGWAAQLKSGDSKLRRNAAFALGKMGSRASSVLKVMKNAYAGEKDAKVRETMVFALGEICRDSVSIKMDKDLEKLFLGAITDSDAQLRRSAAFALGCLASKSEATHQALVNALADQEAIVRQNAAFALGQFGESVLPALKKALRDNDSLVKRDAASVLLQMSDGDKVHELLQDLLPLCRDTNSEVRRAALNVVMRIVDSNDKDAIPALCLALKDTDTENRRNAALALSNIGGKDTAVALPVLLEAGKNGDLEVRRQSVLAVGKIGKSAAAAVPELIRFLRDDKDAKVREFAAVAIGGIRKAAEPAVPLLAKKIQDTGEVPKVRVECAMALTLDRIGDVPAAKDIVPALLEVLSNLQDDAMVRERVMWALRVHRENLRTLKGPLETFSRIIKETPTEENKMLRYDCAYMLGMIWRQEAPDHTLDLLLEFLKHTGVKTYEDTDIRIGGGTVETTGAKESIKERGQGDGRVMAADALLSMGPTRYAGRADIMRQLRVLAADAMLYEPLRKKSAALVKAAR